MITCEKFVTIRSEVVLAINDSLMRLAVNSPQSYILLLADAEYNEALTYNKSLKLIPYSIGNMLDYYKDSSRITFLCEFLNNYYSFDGQDKVEDDLYRMHIELMSYTHAWESKPFLRKLYRLAEAQNSGEYKWQTTEIDKLTTSKIIGNIKEKFGNNSKIVNIIDKGYDRLLRNAFAHSDYQFDISNNKSQIYYKNENKQNAFITFDEWSERFVYSFCLTYFLITILQERKKNVIKDFGQDIFPVEIQYKEKKGYLHLKYDLEHNDFIFAENVK